MKEYPPSIPYEVVLHKQLQDINLAAVYIEASLDDKDKRFFLIALRNVVEAHGGILQLSRKTKLSRPNLYRMMSERGNPEIMSLNKVLNAVGLRLSVVPIKKKVRRTKSSSK